MPLPIRIATRKSPLAVWQAEHVRARLLETDPSLSGDDVVLVPMSTSGDRWLETPLAALGGKNLFVKELERAIFDGEADLAVHSMKDVAAELPDALGITAVLEREDPADAFVSNAHATLADLPEGARIGTCSLRRRSQLLHRRPDLSIGMLRGNVNSRLAKLDAGEHDAIILAAAGLQRLGFDARIRERLSAELCLAAVGQGIIGIETRLDDAPLRERLEPLHHGPTALRLAAERGVSRGLNGGCSAPIGGHARFDGHVLRLVGRVISLDGSTLLEGEAALDLGASAPLDGTPSEETLARAGELGESVAAALFGQGAKALLDAAAAEVLGEGIPSPG